MGMMLSVNSGGFGQALTRPRAGHKQMPTSTEFGRAITNIVKREILSVLRLCIPRFRN
jgi:hypothetical protein